MLGFLLQESVELVVAISNIAYKCGKGVYNYIYPRPCQLGIELKMLQNRIKELEDK